jgi:hypothetical protein
MKPLSLFSVILILGLSGCPVVLLGGAAAGAAGLYNFGQLTATRNATLPQAWQASQTALDDLGIPVVSTERDGLTGLIIGMGTDQKEIKIHLKKIFDDVVEISIRVGMLGDEAQSRIIFERIEKYLAKPAGTGVAPTLP